MVTWRPNENVHAKTKSANCVSSKSILLQEEIVKLIRIQFAMSLFLCGVVNSQEIFYVRCH